jgi:hypothetical protein
MEGVQASASLLKRQVYQRKMDRSKKKQGRD